MTYCKVGLLSLIDVIRTDQLAAFCEKASKK